MFAILFCLFFGWIGRNLYRIRQEEAAIEALKLAGANIYVKTVEGPREHPATAPKDQPLGSWGWSSPASEEDLPSLSERVLGTAEPYPVSKVDLSAELDGPAQQEALAALTRFSDIENVRLYGERFEDESLAPLTGLPKLNDLTISRTQVTGRGLAMLSQCPGLKQLILGELDDDAEIVSGVPSLPHLETLHLYSMRVSRANIEAVASHPTLDSLHVSIVLLAEEDVFSPLRRATSLREFGLALDENSRPLTETDARSIARTPNLRILLLTRFDTSLLDPFLEIETLQVLGLHGARDDLAAGRDFSKNHPACLVECAGTASRRAYFLAGEELDRREGEALLHELEAR